MYIYVGTYMDSFGITLSDIDDSAMSNRTAAAAAASSLSVSVLTGPHSEGLFVAIDGHVMPVGSRAKLGAHTQVYHVARDTLHISTRDFTFKVINSDMSVSGGNSTSHTYKRTHASQGQSLTCLCYASQKHNRQCDVI